MITVHFAVILLSLLSFLTTWLGVVLALKLRENGKAVAAGIGFSVGIMIVISILELIPESIATVGVETTVGSVSAGAALLWVAHLVIPHMHLVGRDVTPGYFQTFRIPIVRGRTFAESDRGGGAGRDPPRIRRAPPVSRPGPDRSHGAARLHHHGHDN